MSYDYQDQDVIINCRLFYSAAGYRPRVQAMADDCELLVVLRGDPDDQHRDYRGRVHVYDYEKARVIDWKQRFPNASEILLISLARPEANPDLRFIEAYVPVMPAFWQLRSPRRRRQRLLHLAHYKFMGVDDFQAQLVGLIRSGSVDVYGARWDSVGIHTHPLSYLAANRLLAGARWCIGLMYPSQRGRSLSGRMWQAPIQGCHVISEPGTNVLACPGVLEVSRYNRASLEALSLLPAPELRLEAARFWQQRTERLAHALSLSLGAPARAVVLQCRWLLIADDLQLRFRQLRSRIPGPRRIRAGLIRRLRPGSPHAS